MPPDRSKGNGKSGRTNPCPICGRTVSRSSDMKRHMKTHDDSAKIPCPFENCTFRTLQRSNLNTHIRRHTNEKIFVCRDEEVCPFATVDSASLLRHRKRLHEYLPGGRIIVRGDPGEDDDIVEAGSSRVRKEASKKKKQTKQKKQTTKRKEKKQKKSNAKPTSRPRRGRARRAAAVEDDDGMDVDEHSGPSELPATSPSSPVPSMSYNAPEPQFTANESPRLGHLIESNSNDRFLYEPSLDSPVVNASRYPSPAHGSRFNATASSGSSRYSGPSHIERPDSPPTFVRPYDPPQEVAAPYSRALESLSYPQQRYENPYSPTYISRTYPQSNPSRAPSPLHFSHPSSPQHESHRLPSLHRSRAPSPVGRYQPYYSHYSSRHSGYSDRGSRGSDYPPNASYLFGDAPRGHHYLPQAASRRAHSPALSSHSYHYYPRGSPSSASRFYGSPPYSYPPLGESHPHAASAPEVQSAFVQRPAYDPDNTSDSASTDEDSLDSRSLYSNGSSSVYSPISSVRSSIGPNDNTATSAFGTLNSVGDIPKDASDDALLRSPDLRRSEWGI